MKDLHTFTASQLATLIRTRQVTSRAVVEAHLARIRATNDVVNAVTVVLEESALAAADEADRREPRGPLHGVPFTLKENFDCVGTSTTFGLRGNARALPFVDAPVVERMKAAGAIVLGRTNLSELAMRLCTDNPLRGRTRNPLNRALTVGGSSGGDAAAVAVGMAPLGIGTDLGGSLRVPAHFCGVAALKPTTGRVPHAASLEPLDYGLSGQLMAADGPLARSVEDLAMCLRVLSGRHVRDPRSVDAPLQGPPPAEKRAALLTELPGAPLPPDALAAVRRAGDLLGAAGWQVEEASPPELERLGDVWLKVMATDLQSMIPLLGPAVSPELLGHLQRMHAVANPGPTSQLRLHTERSRLGRLWSGFLTEYPVLVGPNLAAPPWAPDADLHPTRGLEMLRVATRMLLPGNALGIPVVALPMGVSHGVPTSVQFHADLWREDLCLEAAAVVEAGVPRVVPVHPDDAQ